MFMEHWFNTPWYEMNAIESGGCQETKDQNQ